MTALGRHFKGTGRRIQATIYIDNKMLEIIDRYAVERQRAGEKSYSRSEFYHEAAVAKLRELGRLPDENEAEKE
jgi:hypothetical protein